MSNKFQNTKYFLQTKFSSCIKLSKNTFLIISLKNIFNKEKILKYSFKESCEFLKTFILTKLSVIYGTNEPIQIQ